MTLCAVCGHRGGRQHLRRIGGRAALDGFAASVRPLLDAWRHTGQVLRKVFSTIRVVLLSVIGRVMVDGAPAAEMGVCRGAVRDYRHTLDNPLFHASGGEITGRASRAK